MAGPPFVSVAMPCLDEAAYIEGCLRSVLAQDYPADRLEVLVADGGSTDGTLDVLARVAARDPRVHVVPNPRRIQAAGMNEAIRAARGAVIVRMDVHCEYAPDYVRRCVEALQETGAANVGGAQRPRARTSFQRALAAALRSPLGVGGARYRSEENEGDVDTVFLGAFPRAVFEEVGLYDPGAVTNEDAELNQRIREAGGRVHLSRSIVVHYFPRDGFRPLARQYYRYGRGRARTLLKHRRLASWRPVLPFAALVAGGALVLVPVLRPWAPLAFAAYAVLAGLEALRVAGREGPGTALLAGAQFPVMHVSHGAGFAAGLVRYARRPDWPAQPERLPPSGSPRPPVA
jgi:glycosyltransferase involved in cell wall biosynthesis